MKKIKRGIDEEIESFISDTQLYVKWLGWTCASHFFKISHSFKEISYKIELLPISTEQLIYAFNYMWPDRLDSGLIRIVSKIDRTAWENDFNYELLMGGLDQIDDLEITSHYSFLSIWKFSLGLSQLYAELAVDVDSQGNPQQRLHLFRACETYKNLLEKKAFKLMGYWEVKKEWKDFHKMRIRKSRETMQRSRSIKESIILDAFARFINKQDKKTLGLISERKMAEMILANAKGALEDASKPIKSLNTVISILRRRDKNKFPTYPWFTDRTLK